MHVHIARDCHPFTCYRTVLLYMCYALVICTLNFAFIPHERCPVGQRKRFPAYCTLTSYISVMLIPPQITEVSKFFSTTLANSRFSQLVSSLYAAGCRGRSGHTEKMQPRRSGQISGHFLAQNASRDAKVQYKSQGSLID